MPQPISRRHLLQAAAFTGAAPAFLRGQNAPGVPHGAIAGDVIPGRAMIWSRTDKPARMVVEWSSSERGPRQRVRGPYCLDITDYTGRLELTDLPPGQTIYYEVSFEDLTAKHARSQPVSGTFRTTSMAPDRPLRVLWSGDTCGQGWGINPEFGGMKIYETMRRLNPDLFVHSGDTIYADGPLVEQVKLPDGSTWRNIVTPEKSKVAETLAEYRGQYKYNLMDENMRRFHAEVAQVWQWDDHEVCNNYSSSKVLAAPFKERSIDVLVANATKAFLEYAPIRYSPSEIERVYRQIPCGPNLDIFVLDMRSYRGPNSYNLQTQETDDSAFMGRPQVAWLEQGLKQSKAKWKLIAADMPIGLVVSDGEDAQGRPQFEAIANGDNGPARGREVEFARLLKFIKDQNIRNTVWVTADVHYTAAHHYHPDRAQFRDFLPFWEFVSGPLHAGAFGPNKLDGTFGPEVAYQKHPAPDAQNSSPATGMMFFGEIVVGAQGRELTVNLRDLAGQVLYSKVLSAAA